MNTMQIERGSNLARIVALVGSRKKKAFVSIVAVPSKQVQTPLGGWDSGSRDLAYLLHGNTRAEPAKQQTAFDPKNLNPAFVTIDDDHAMLTSGTFAGKEATPSLTCTQAFFDKYVK